MMSCNSLAKDITSALKTTTIASTDIFPLVSSDTLYGVTFSSIQAALGVTGSINPLGSDTAVQIINKPSTGVNFIRSILPTQGITATIDSSENISIKTNLANAGSSSDGSQLIVDPTAAQIKFKRLKAGSGITITETADSIIIAVS